MEAFPLHWPEGWPRAKWRQPSRFITTLAKARDGLFSELERLGASNIILSTDIPLRKDGLPYAGKENPSDPGIAVYFQYKRKPMVFACDQYEKSYENMQAVRKTIEALRGIERWGASQMMERAFNGFAALPGPDRPWREVMGFAQDESIDRLNVETRYRTLAKKTHPDAGGSQGLFLELQRAKEQAMKELG